VRDLIPKGRWLTIEEIRSGSFSAGACEGSFTSAQEEELELFKKAIPTEWQNAARNLHIGSIQVGEFYAMEDDEGLEIFEAMEIERCSVRGKVYKCTNSCELVPSDEPTKTVPSEKIKPVLVERMKKRSKPNDPKAVDRESYPIYFVGLGEDTPCTWHTIRSKAGAVYYLTCKNIRKSLQKKSPGKGPTSWSVELGDPRMLMWTPQFKRLHESGVPIDCIEIVWLIFHHALPVRERLHRHGHPDVLTPNCLDCTGCPETITHLLFGCVHVRRVWKWIDRVWRKITGSKSVFGVLLVDQTPDPIPLMRSFLKAYFVYNDADLDGPALLWLNLLCLTVQAIYGERNKSSLSCATIEEGIVNKKYKKSTDTIIGRLAASIRSQVEYRYYSIEYSQTRDNFRGGIIEATRGGKS